MTAEAASNAEKKSARQGVAAARAIGLLMGLAAALIGGGWQVATRAATTGQGALPGVAAVPIAPADLALLRYAIPALVLAPVLWRIGLVPRLAESVSRWRLLLLWIGAGLPFGLVAMAGSRLAPAAHMGVLMAGASPLFATAFAFLVWREKPGPMRLIGLALMTLAVAVLGGRSLLGDAALGEAWRGDLLFLFAAALWALYTLGFRRIGLGPWQAAALVNGWSAIAVLAWAAARGGTPLFELPASQLVWHALWQGLLGGVLGLWTYSVAIERLGAAQAAAFGALAPVVSAVAGWWWLGDALSWLDGLAVCAAMLGVALASGVVSASRGRIGVGVRSFRREAGSRATSRRRRPLRAPRGARR